MINASYKEFKMAITIPFEKRMFLIRNYKKIFLIGLITRLIFAPWTGHPYDLPIWYYSGKDLAMGISPYTSYIHIGQTILWAIWTALSYKISQLMFHTSTYVIIFLIKLLPIFVDILLPIEIIQIINKYSGKILSSKEEKLILMIIWLNPYFIIVSSWWAQIDNLAFLVIIIAIELILENRIVIPILLTTISISLKLYPVIFLPPLALILYFRSRSFMKSVFFSITVVVIFFCVAYAPFFIFNWNTQQMTGVLTSQLTRTSGGITFFGIITNLSVGNPFTKYFLSLLNAINGIWYLNYIWMVPSFLLSCYYFLSYHYLIHEHKMNQKALQIKIFNLGINMLLYYYITWLLTAKWVSEQNFIPLLCLLIIKYIIIDNELPAKNKIRGYFIYLNILILTFLSFNAPLFAFFFLFINVQAIENSIIYFQSIRSFFLVLSTIGIMIYSINIIRILHNDRTSSK